MEPCLPEALLLLALDDETGTVVPPAAVALPAALAAAVLLELGLRGRLHDQPDGTVTVVGDPTGDPILDDTARRISRVLRGYPADTWVEWLARDVPHMRELVAERLVARGILERRGRAVRWPFSTRRYRLADAAARRRICETMRAPLVDEAATSDARTLALLILVRAANLSGALADGVLAGRTLRERLQARRRVDVVTGADRLRAFPSGLSGALVGSVAAGTLAYAAAQLLDTSVAGDAAAGAGAGGTGESPLDVALNVGGSVWDAFDAGGDSGGDGGGGD